MGEIADMMLDGTLCECCGEFIGDATGYPGYCSKECAEGRGATFTPSDHILGRSKPQHDKPFFVVKKEHDLKALGKFLEGVSYTYFDDSQPDKKGNPRIRLHYDKYPNKDHAWGVECRGNVVCLNTQLFDRVRDIVKQHERPE